MSAPGPDRLWWSAAELAEAALPDMPASVQRITAHAKDAGWRGDAAHARRRAGRGGGWEYHWSLLPLRARQRLLREAAIARESRPVNGGAADEDRAARHTAFEALPEPQKEEARLRLRIVQAVLASTRGGLTRSMAVAQVAGAEGKSPRTVWNWLQSIEGIAPADWLPCLAPAYAAGPRKARSEDAPEFLALVYADYLRPERPSLATCCRRAGRIARARGIPVLPERTVRRRLKADIPRVTQVYRREGYPGLARCYPPQIRDRSGLHALEAVNADCHKFDVFVRWPGQDAPSRAQIVAFQDVFSGKILSWRIDHTPNKVMVMAAFGDLVEEWGIPKHCLFDNGREFANKWLTGGAKTRFRFKIRDDDPAGVMTLMGIELHWATPGHGQAKPIERAFRDLADEIARDPRFAGAYVGHKPDAKPENYGAAAIDLERFVAVVAEGIAEHNARLGRLSPTAKGGSFDEAFARSYATAPIRRATAEQRRLWLMGQEVRKLNANHGRLTLHGNSYWSEFMAELAGSRIVARFDPEDLHGAVSIYALDGRYLGEAACEVAAGFFDAAEAQAAARRRAAINRAEKRLARALSPLSVEDVARGLDEAAPAAPEKPEARVISMETGRARPARRGKALPTPASSADEEAAHEVFYRDFRAAAATQAPQEEDDPLARFERAHGLLARAAEGKRIGEAEAEWLSSYRQSAEFRQQMEMYEIYGDRMFAK